ncbi:MAG: nucleotidyltransferase domain-containing protein [Promethearchaeota archaeon]
MARLKLARAFDRTEVRYSEDHWRTLAEVRERGKAVDEALRRAGVEATFYGSFARGDVTPASDVDAFVPHQVPSFLLENAIESAGLQVTRREIVQATPGDLVKAHVYLPGDACVTFPLVKPRQLELEFYKFGGALRGPDFSPNRRVPGVNKRLELIVPTPEGHESFPLKGNEKVAVKLLGVTGKVLEARARVLGRRDRVGRTGVFLKQAVAPDQTFEEVLKGLADGNSLVRRRVLGRS